MNMMNLDNCMVVFYITHKFYRDVQIKGVLDMDYYGEVEDPIQYFDENKELTWKIPQNPYRAGTKEYVAYQMLCREFEPDEDFTSLLLDCEGLEFYYSEWYDLEIEELTWESI